jgi:hypothetical protein
MSCQLTVSVVWWTEFLATDPEVDSRRYQIFWLAVGVERGPLSLVRKTEELFEGKVAAPV